MPKTYRDTTYVTGIELDPVSARIVSLLQPKARIISGDFVRTDLTPIYDLAIGNPHSRIVLSALIAPIVRSAFVCTTISSPGRSTS